MRVALTLIAMILAVISASCATTTYRLPAIGQAIYCPHCDADLYQRVEGTSRTIYRRADYAQCRFDCPAPPPGEEHICPLCHQQITYMRDGIMWTHYRDRVE